MIKLESKALKGSFPPVVTPFKADGSVDYDTYAHLIDFQAKGGSHGVVVCGTTAEPSTLTPEERMELLKVAIDAAAGRIQVVAATGTQNHADTVRMTEAADKAGADALLIVTPYFIRPPQRGLEAYYLDLCRRTDMIFERAMPSCFASTEFAQMARRMKRRSSSESSTSRTE